MGFKDKLGKYYSDAYMQKYGDRMTSVSGTILSVKTETKSILGIFNKIRVYLVVKPEAGKQIVKCQYKMNKWFKKPTFIDVNQGHKVIIMGIKGEKGKADSDTVVISNIANLTTKKDLHPFDHAQIKKARQQATKMRTR
ncbi:Uncharacterised protein [uncultured Clostridium sp.]|uniref:hypothetical protein n=1 Tax=uncultured Clostridium sp. TaxID=59620 RepID=UPI000820B7A3|nr:hypothetical protein [uncultured Clostridium sp.]SCI77470.1 Uncharacterised protein [uncultured Clostridium sp.]